MGDILTGTPPELTYLHPFVRDAWMVVWAITSGALAVILGWMGLSFIVQEHLGHHQSGWREMVPRLVLGLTAAASSLWWCALVIDVADAVSGFIAVSLDVTPGDLLRAPLFALLAAVETANTGLAVFIALLYLVFGFFVLYLLVQMILRLALIDILLTLAPIALGLWILPHTAGWGKHWLRLFMTAVFQQAIQLIAVALAFAFLGEFAVHRRVRAVGGPGVEAADGHRLHVPGGPCPLDAGASRHLRRLAAHPLLRDVAARFHDALRPFHRADRGRGRRWPGGNGGRDSGNQRGQSRRHHGRRSGELGGPGLHGPGPERPDAPEPGAVAGNRNDDNHWRGQVSRRNRPGGGAMCQ